ncbi:MAG: hypothetical protein ACRD3C_10795 [Vicinamibacterales bacterium]
MRKHVLAFLLALSFPLAAQEPWQPPRTPDGQPDMQGIWQFDGGAAAAVSAMVSLEGDRGPFAKELLRWYAVEEKISAFKPKTTSFVVDPPDGVIPYQPWTSERRLAQMENTTRPTKREHVDPNARSLLTGVPRINSYPTPLQIVQVPGAVLLLYENKHAYRVVPLDGRPHVSSSIKLYLGDSRGRWEGNTLVVDVTNQNGLAWIDALGFSSDQLHVVERWTMAVPDRIDYRATLTDPTVFTRPWTLSYSFVRDKRVTELMESAEFEGNRIVEMTLGGAGR